jgi:DNA polymerase-4
MLRCPQIVHLGRAVADTGEYKQASMWRRFSASPIQARRWVAHVDMDAFFASVEQRDNPALRGCPVIVANSPVPLDQVRTLADEARKLPHPPEFIKGIRGVVASASYEARAFGVRSAMPLAKAMALCPDAITVEGRFGRYREVADQLQAIWAEFSPVIEPMSLDEAYLDITGFELSGTTVRIIGERLKARIREETGLTASVGMGSSKLMAKIASDLDKPDGLVIVPHGEEARTLAPLSVRVLPGIGPRSAEALDVLGIKTVGELANAKESLLALAFGPQHAQDLLRRAVGQDDSPVQPPGDPKSISREITLAEDETDLEVLKSRLRVLADRVGWSLRQEGFVVWCVYVKLRLLPRQRVWRAEGSGYGRLITRQCTLGVPTDTGKSIYEAAARLLDSAAGSTGLGAGKEVVRLLGVGTSNLVRTNDLVGYFSSEVNKETSPPVADQDEVALEDSGREQKLDASLDSIRERYGFGSISLGSGLKRPDTDVLKD